LCRKLYDTNDFGKPERKLWVRWKRTDRE
jgi:hypothetical protein